MKNKLSIYEENGLYGFVDNKGNVVIPCQFENAHEEFSEGLAGVCNDDSFWGFINEHGGLVIEYFYVDANPFSEGFAAVSYWNADEDDSGVLDDDGVAWGFIDKRNNLIVDYKYAEVKDFKNGFAAVKNFQDCWGFIDKKGNELVQCQYSFVSDITDPADEGLGILEGLGISFKYPVALCMGEDGTCVLVFVNHPNNTQEIFTSTSDQQGNIILPSHLIHKNDFDEFD